jgi:hypothetical protein
MLQLLGFLVGIHQGLHRFILGMSFKIIVQSIKYLFFESFPSLLLKTSEHLRAVILLSFWKNGLEVETVSVFSINTEYYET